ncbi:MAG: HEPN domain-containing protein [Bacteroidota bacterium]|nr:HEPN domain-containing protein [Bacteroidota bacterium]
MNYLNNKSKCNIKGANLLISNKLFAPSVHCSYYAVFQKIKYLYIYKSEISYEDFHEETQQHKGSSHTYLINKFVTMYGRMTNDKYKKRYLRNQIRELKASRQEADYDNKEVSSEISIEVLKKSKKIISNINKLI